MIDSSRDNKKEKRFFAIFAVAVVVIGAALFLWGQNNGTYQVFNSAFFRYDFAKVRDADPGWKLTEEEQARRDELLAEAAAWKASARGERRTFRAVTAADDERGVPEVEIAYDVYDNGSDTTVVILHGFDESTAESEIYAPYWWDKGFNVMIPELRGHRGEDMEPTTFGVWESLDLYDMICAEGLDSPDKRLIVCGRSIGGDAALLLAENDGLGGGGIDLIVAETVYTDLKTYELRCLRRQYNLGNIFVGEMLDSLCKRGFGFEPDEINIRTRAVVTHVPAVFLAADEKVVGGDMTTTVYDAWGGEKKLVWLESGRYPSVYAAALDSGRYDAAVSALLELTEQSKEEK